MKRILLAVCPVLLLFLISCESHQPIMVPEPEPAGDQVVSGWVSLSDGTFHADDEGLTPDGYYVKVTRRLWATFAPTSGVLGKGAPIDAAGKKQPGWIELDDGSIHTVEAGVVPRPPYVKGQVDEAGKFYPDPIEVVE